MRDPSWSRYRQQLLLPGERLAANPRRPEAAALFEVAEAHSPCCARRRRAGAQRAMMTGIVSPQHPVSNSTDLGHRGEVDVTQIEKMLQLTPTERLRKHESWRLFARKALKDAELDSGRRMMVGR
jgi:hypothetical protein